MKPESNPGSKNHDNTSGKSTTTTPPATKANNQSQSTNPKSHETANQHQPSVPPWPSQYPTQQYPQANPSYHPHHSNYVDPQFSNFQGPIDPMAPPGYGPPPPYYPPPPAPQPYPPPPPPPPPPPYYQPWYPQNVAAQVTRDAWTTGLFDCLDDPSNALVTLFCPCLTFGQVVEMVDMGNTTCGSGVLLYILVVALLGTGCPLTCTYRTRMRRRYGLLEHPAPDWLVHLFCDYCALCQQFRELRNRGFDPSLGWYGNARRNQEFQRAQDCMAPPMNQTMRG